MIIKPINDFIFYIATFSDLITSPCFRFAFLYIIIRGDLKHIALKETRKGFSLADYCHKFFVHYISSELNGQSFWRLDKN